MQCSGEELHEVVDALLRVVVVAVQVLDEQSPEVRGDAVGGRVEIDAGRDVGGTPEHLHPALAVGGFERGAHLERVLVAEHGVALHEAQELALVDHARELPLRRRRDDLDERRGLGEVGDLVDPAPEPVGPVHLTDQVGLRGEVVVEAGHRDPRVVGQLPHAHRRGAPLREEPQGRLHDPVSGGDRGDGPVCGHASPGYLNVRSSTSPPHRFWRRRYALYAILRRQNIDVR